MHHHLIILDHQQDYQIIQRIRRISPRKPRHIQQADAENPEAVV